MKIITTKILIFLFIISACNVEPESLGKVNSLEKINNVQNDTSVATLNPEGEIVLKGQLKGRDILMKIFIKDCKMEGGYYFSDEGIERLISGSIIHNTDGEMTEYDENNNPVGIIKGVGNLQGVAKLIYSQADGSNPTPFTIRKVKDVNLYKPN